MPGAWAYARVESAADAVRETLPDIIGSDGARLVFRGRPEPVGPPAGATRYEARWQIGRSTGEAHLLLFPVSADLCEIHLTLHSSAPLIWRGPRLTRLAQELAGAVATAATRPEALRRRPAVERETLAARWMYRPASGGSPSR